MTLLHTEMDQLTDGTASTTPQTVYSLLATCAAVVPIGLRTQPRAACTTSSAASDCVYLVFHPRSLYSYDPARYFEMAARGLGRTEKSLRAVGDDAMMRDHQDTDAAGAPGRVVRRKETVMNSRRAQRRVEMALYRRR